MAALKFHCFMTLSNVYVKYKYLQKQLFCTVSAQGLVFRHFMIKTT